MLKTAYIRGAITAEENSRECILQESKVLLKEIIERNHLCTDRIQAVLFTATRDLDQAYPAVAAREIGLTNAALMCMQEMYVENSLQMCIRVMVTADIEEGTEINHTYLKGAQVLRPDLKK